MQVFVIKLECCASSWHYSPSLECCMNCFILILSSQGQKVIRPESRTYNRQVHYTDASSGVRYKTLQERSKTKFKLSIKVFRFSQSKIEFVLIYKLAL